MYNNMHIIKCKDGVEISRRAAFLVAEAIHRDPHCILGLATGSSPVGMYQTLVRIYEGGRWTFPRFVPSTWMSTIRSNRMIRKAIAIS